VKHEHEMEENEEEVDRDVEIVLQEYTDKTLFRFYQPECYSWQDDMEKSEE